MKDREIFELFEKSTKISRDKVIDYRPCSQFYNDASDLAIKDAITIKLKDNGTVIYIPETDAEGNKIRRSKPREMSYDGNIFVLPDGQKNDACVVTTNSQVKNDGRAVMGAGIAKYCRDTFTGCDAVLGYLLRTKTENVPYFLKCYPIPGKEGCFSLVSFPTKYDWRESSVPELIRKSCQKIVKLADEYHFTNVYMPCPGCSNGHLDYWKDVRPILLDELDSRFVICVPDRIRYNE